MRRATLAAALTGGILLGAGAPAALAQEDTQPPTPPTNVRVTDATWQNVSLAFEPAKDNVHVPRYRVFVNGQEYPHFEFSWSQAWLSKLEAGKRYTITLRAVDSSGNVSADSEPVTATMDRWNAPTGLRATVGQDGAVALNWTSGNGDLRTQYEILDGSRLETIVPLDTPTTVTIPRLAPGTHTLEVRARGMVFTGEEPTAASRVTVTVPDRGGTDRTPPSVPANVRTFLNHRYEVFMSWDASTDNVDPSSTIRYDILTFDHRNQQWYVRESTASPGPRSGSSGARTPSGPSTPRATCPRWRHRTSDPRERAARDEIGRAHV